MANNLTGDFDVVAEFAIPAVNRVLAAMHQTGRFLHSVSSHVDDNPHPDQPGGPTVIGVVDQFGLAIANQRQVGNPSPVGGPSAVTDAVQARLGGILNPGVLGLTQLQTTPSHISGTVQMQLSPPVLSSPASADAPLTVTTNIMSRYFPDHGSAPLAEFMRGDLSITAPINRVVSGGVRMLEIDFKAQDATIHFNPSYLSTPLSDADLAGINLCIQNGLRSSFLPSSVNLPAAIADLQMKTLPGAIAILLDLNDHTPQSTSGSVNQVFTSGGDDFAFAVGIDYLRNTFQALIGPLVGQTISLPPIPVNLLLTTIHISYDVTLTAITVDLVPNQLVLTIQGNATQTSHKGYLPDTFTFTGTVNFTLAVDGPTVDLVIGTPSANTSSAEINIFRGTIADNLKSAVDSALQATGPNGLSAYDTVRQMFDANQNLGQFLNPQLNPTDGNPPAEPQQLFFVYNEADIQPDGIVVHGSLLVFDWPAPHVEFEQIPSNTTGPVAQPVLPQGPDYSALNTWIPGGTIAQYAWSVQGQEQAYPFDVDANRFVLLHSAGLVADAAISGTPVPGFAPLCLTITGTRISNFGPVAYQTVTGSVCGFTKFNVGVLSGVTSGLTDAPMLAITCPGPSGNVVVTGCAAAQLDQTGITAPNLIIHFANFDSVAQLKALPDALEQSKRSDAPTAIIAVLSPGELLKASFTSGIIYSDDQEGWLGAFGAKSDGRPLTLIVSPKGEIVWQQEGSLQTPDLAAALEKNLVKRSPVRVIVPRLNARIGQGAANFLFEYAPGREMPLAKLKGQSVVVAFWKSAAKPSIQAVRQLQANTGKGKVSPFLLAVNDGDDPQVARAVAAESGITATLVTDPNREISSAYGVSLWPTIVRISPSGAVTGIAYGHAADGQVPSPPSAAGSR